jgi:S-methyl-5-thioribose-1-phosphate isomerase
MIEQNKLPFHFEIFDSRDYRTTAHAIKTMLVRGAGAIGATAAYGLAQAFQEFEGNEEKILEARKEIEGTRPTASNLFYATKRVFDNSTNAQAAWYEAQKIADEDVEACKKIGEYGNEFIEDESSIETHCNAGWLAFVDWGTALSPVYVAHRKKKDLFVFADETRPRSQGARLTAWELRNEGVPHAIIPDNAGAWLMKQGKIDLMIVGSDRIARNGDVANKIGTLEKAIAANYYGIPFYVAAPTSTIDLNCPNGDAIPIEHRSPEEVFYQTGPTENGRMEKVRVSSPESDALNPAFDVTPAKLVKAIITERGIVEASGKGIESLF